MNRILEPFPLLRALRLLRYLQPRFQDLDQMPRPNFTARPRAHQHSDRPLVDSARQLQIELPRCLTALRLLLQLLLRLQLPVFQLRPKLLQPTSRLQLLPLTHRVAFGFLYK